MNNRKLSPKIFLPERADQRFTAKEKEYILQQAAQSSVSLEKLCQQYGISRALLKYWQTEAVPTIRSAEHKRRIRSINSLTKSTAKTRAEHLYRVLLTAIPHAKRDVPAAKAAQDSKSVILRGTLFADRGVYILLDWLNRNRVYFQFDGDYEYYFDTFEASLNFPSAMEAMSAWLEGQAIETVQKKLAADPKVYSGDYKDTAVAKLQTTMLAALPQAKTSEGYVYHYASEPTTFYLESIRLPERQVSIRFEIRKSRLTFFQVYLSHIDFNHVFSGPSPCTPVGFQASNVAICLPIIAEWFCGVSIENMKSIIKAKSEILRKVQFFHPSKGSNFFQGVIG